MPAASVLIFTQSLSHSISCALFLSLCPSCALFSAAAEGCVRNLDKHPRRRLPARTSAVRRVAIMGTVHSARPPTRPKSRVRGPARPRCACEARAPASTCRPAGPRRGRSEQGALARRRTAPRAVGWGERRGAGAHRARPGPPARAAAMRAKSFPREATSLHCNPTPTYTLLPSRGTCG